MGSEPRLTKRRLAAVLLAMDYVVAGTTEDLTGYSDKNSEALFEAASEGGLSLYAMWERRYGDENYSDMFGDFGVD